MKKFSVGTGAGYLLLLTLSILFIAHDTYIGRYLGDDGNAIKLGLDTVEKNFLISHGKVSFTSHMTFPPGFALFMGVMVLLFDYPHYIMMAIATITVAAIIISAYTYRKYLSGPTALFSLMILALNPVIVSDAHTMWEPTPTLITSALALFFFTRFLDEKRTLDYVAGVSALVIGCQFFFSVFFLMPGLILFTLLYCRSIGVKGLLLAFVCSLFISTPYFFYLFLEGGLVNDLAHAQATLDAGGEYILHRKYIFTTDIFVSMPSIRMVFFWFHNRELATVEYLGTNGFYIIYLAMIFSLFFIMGMAKMVINGFLTLIGSPKSEPVESIYKVSWLFITVAIISLYVLKSPMAYYYPVPMLPFVAVITGIGATTFWRYLPWRVVTYAAAASHTLLLVVMMVFPRADGYWRQNGPSFQTQKQIVESILEKTKENERPSAILDGNGIYDKTLNYLLYSMWEGGKAELKFNDRYFAVRVAKDQIDQKIRWSVTDITNDVDEYFEDINQLLSHIDLNEKVMVEGLYANFSYPWHADLKRRSHHRAEGLKGVLQKKVGSVVEWDSDAIASGAPDVIAIAHNDPRIIEPNSLKYNSDHIREILSSGHYRLRKEFNTITLFDRGRPDSNDAKLVARYLNTYQMTDLPGIPLAFYPHSDGAILTSNPKQNRFLSHNGEKKKNVIYGPYIDLDKGDYEVEFRIKKLTCDAGSNLYFDVSIESGERVISTLERSCSNFAEDMEKGFLPVTLNFTIGESGARKAEFRIYMSGNIVILGDYARLTKLYGA